MIRNKTAVKILYGVIAGGGERRRSDKVAVSMLYPFFVEESLSLSSIARSGGRVSDDRVIEDLSFSSVILAGGLVRSVVVRYDDSEDLDFSSLILAGGQVKTVVVRYNDDGEELGNFSSMILSGGQITKIVVSYDLSEFDAGELNFSSSILDGGLVSA